MPLDRILHGNEQPRTEAQVKAARLLPMTEEEVRSLSDAELATLERDAAVQRLYHECNDGILTRADHDAISKYRSLETLAATEMEQRRENRIGHGTLQTLSGIQAMLGGRV